MLRQTRLRYSMRPQLLSLRRHHGAGDNNLPAHDIAYHVPNCIPPYQKVWGRIDMMINGRFWKRKMPALLIILSSSMHPSTIHTYKIDKLNRFAMNSQLA